LSSVSSDLHNSKTPVTPEWRHDSVPTAPLKIADHQGSAVQLPGTLCNRLESAKRQRRGLAFAQPTVGQHRGFSRAL